MELEQLNRKESQPLLDRELACSQRHGRILALLMIDVDQFKTANDRDGHPAGDVVLRNIAERLCAQVRASSTDIAIQITI